MIRLVNSVLLVLFLYYVIVLSRVALGAWGVAGGCIMSLRQLYNDNKGYFILFYPQQVKVTGMNNYS